MSTSVSGRTNEHELWALKLHKWCNEKTEGHETFFK